jgi:hypothetical protein
MKKSTFLIILCIASIFGASLMAYQFQNRSLDMAARYISAINLDQFQFRGAMQNPNLKKIDSSVDLLMKTQLALQAINPLFEQKPLEALARYQQLLETDPAHLGLRIRLGMLQLKQGQRAAAKENLYFVYEQKDAGLQPDAAWFLALLAIVEQDNELAKQLLKESIDSECTYKEEATELRASF